MTFQLVCIEPKELTQYKSDMQEAFQKGFEDAFGKTDAVILPEKDIDQSLNAPPGPRPLYRCALLPRAWTRCGIPRHPPPHSYKTYRAALPAGPKTGNLPKSSGPPAIPAGPDGCDVWAYKIPSLRDSICGKGANYDRSIKTDSLPRKTVPPEQPYQQ